jgi:hypothetical protein
MASVADRGLDIAVCEEEGHRSQLSFHNRKPGLRLGILVVSRRRVNAMSPDLVEI